MHKRNAGDTPATSTISQEGNKFETRASSTQSDDSQGSQGLMDESQSIESTQTLGQHSQESSGSSLCQFCRDRDLPLLDHVVTEAFDLIGSRPLDRIVMTVLLREDNLYHVNIRELGTGFVVGCLLANDAAIEEAISLGLFEQILTFCVTDVRSTIKPKDGPFAIHFELIEKRENGGGFNKETAETKKVQKFATQVLGLNIGYVSLLFSLTNAIKMDKQASDCNFRPPSGFPAQVNRDPGELFSSRLILIDNVENYSTRSCTDSEGRDNLGSSSSLFLRIVTGRADREEH
ncbi:uncharacterized protein LOC117582145 [Drosophila guanche]|nr:uncharacterized protein LOC117582145 [Drosophila guanche]